MRKAFVLLERLQNGQVHSGEDIAVELGISRGAVWAQVKRLQAQGVEIHAVSGKGYRLPGGYEFLDQRLIYSGLASQTQAVIGDLRVDRVTDSTNERLLDLATEQTIHGVAWLAEYQTRGRGRRGGSWLAPPGSGLCLSLGWCFNSPPQALSALSLVVGVAIVRALNRCGATELKLKWPNDLYHHDSKLAGILIEMRSEFGGPCTVAIGVGINVALSRDAREHINEPITDVSAACASGPSRNKVASVIIDELTSILTDFERSGFEHYRSEWQDCDLLADRQITIEMPDRTVVGIGRGIGTDGTLLVEHDGITEPFLSGHIVIKKST
ncbi:MAG: BirA family biotin operon repressor/biotin-[acetyl-CoA-carboxylase] ligase [Gammaproteobacteria bacterium]|jgi:BirA family biotin operon repressor/biotin-[acetyl-CoA-carboxylase] ligase